MKPAEIIRTIMNEKGVGIAEMSRRLGVPMWKGSNRLTQSENMTYKTMLQFCDALDYKIVIMPKGSRTPKGGYEVDLRVCESIDNRTEE